MLTDIFQLYHNSCSANANKSICGNLGLIIKIGLDYDAYFSFDKLTKQLAFVHCPNTYDQPGYGNDVLDACSDLIVGQNGGYFYRTSGTGLESDGWLTHEFGRASGNYDSNPLTIQLESISQGIIGIIGVANSRNDVINVQNASDLSFKTIENIASICPGIFYNNNGFYIDDRSGGSASSYVFKIYFK